MVAPLLSQTYYTGIPSKIHHLNRQKIGISSKTVYRVAPTTRTDFTSHPDDDQYSVNFCRRLEVRNQVKKLLVHSPKYLQE